MEEFNTQNPVYKIFSFTILLELSSATGIIENKDLCPTQKRIPK